MLLSSFFFQAAVAITLSVASDKTPQDQTLAALFEAQKVDGTMVLAALDGGTQFVHNPERASKRYCPASTFKIPNTLIALDSGVLADENQTYPWDGKPKYLEQWNQDQNLTTAFASSCVWFFQEVARHLDLTRYAAYLKQFDYGNQTMGTDVTTFWLDDTLRISATEQIGFLRRLLKKELGVKESAFELLRKVMKTTDLGNCSMWAKTGWAMRTADPMGWYVGYVEVNGTTWLFAMNMDIPQNEMAKYRQELVLEALQAKGICTR